MSSDEPVHWRQWLEEAQLLSKRCANAAYRVAIQIEMNNETIENSRELVDERRLLIAHREMLITRILARLQESRGRRPA